MYLNLSLFLFQTQDCKKLCWHWKIKPHGGTNRISYLERGTKQKSLSNTKVWAGRAQKSVLLYVFTARYTFSYYILAVFSCKQIPDIFVIIIRVVLVLRKVVWADTWFGIVITHGSAYATLRSTRMTLKIISAKKSKSC